MQRMVWVSTGTSVRQQLQYEGYPALYITTYARAPSRALAVR